MKYQSTRSNIYATSTEAVLSGMAPDGGLYGSKELGIIPFNWENTLDLTVLKMAEAILSYLLPDFTNMEELVTKAYENKFETEDLTPVVKVGDNYVLELFRGPTSAFKDVALSMLPQLMTAARKLEGSQKETVILTATSGDTGKAALEGFHDVEGTKIMVFYPNGGVSPIQRAQMATQVGKNVKVCAVDGNFDDCQTAVKEAFATINGKNLLEGKNKTLSSANSINIGRLAPQVVYYFKAYSDLVKNGVITKGQKVDYVVPTGNFGDILAGYYSKLMGLPVGKLVCASNANNVLTDFLNTGIYNKNRTFMKTTSPSMDILVSSNLERLLFIASDYNTEKVAQWMSDLKKNNVFTVEKAIMDKINETFYGDYCNEEETEKTIGQVWKDNGYLSDPHTAVALNVAQKYKEQSKTKNPVVVLSTASPYKFPGPVLKAIGITSKDSEFDQMEKLYEITKVPVPKNLSSLRGKEELHKDVINRSDILSYILNFLEN